MAPTARPVRPARRKFEAFVSRDAPEVMGDLATSHITMKVTAVPGRYARAGLELGREDLAPAREPEYARGCGRAVRECTEDPPMLAAASNDYYSTTAQVLPVLLLVVLFELRWEGQGEAMAAVYSGAAIGALVLGEMAALHALAEAPSPATDAFVLFAYSIGGTALIVGSFGRIETKALGVSYFRRHPGRFRGLACVYYVLILAVGVVFALDFG